MGQKTHPKGFRLVTTQKHLSNWYTSKSRYSLLAHEDFFIRQAIENSLKNILTTSSIQISRSNNNLNFKEQVNIKICALYPRVKELQKAILTHSEQNTQKKTNLILNAALQSEVNLKKIVTIFLKQKIIKLLYVHKLKTKKLLNIKFEFIKNPFEDATLIAKYLVDQLEKRIPFRRAIKQTIKKVQYTMKKGLKIQISGRLNGIEIARTEWKREGRIPLHTLNAHIDYAHQVAHTIYGLIGIKVWLFEKLG